MVSPISATLPRVADVTNAAPPRLSRAFWLLWGFDAVVAAIVVFFFLWGLSDGTVSSFNIVLWLAMLSMVSGVVFGSLALRRANHGAAAFGLLMVLAIPGLGMTLLLVSVLILHPRWN